MTAIDKRAFATLIAGALFLAAPVSLSAQTTPPAPSTTAPATTAPAAATPPAAAAPAATPASTATKKTKKSKKKAAEADASTTPPPASTTAAPPAPAAAGSPVFPSAVDSKYASQKAGDARMHTCLDQYHANKAANGNGGLKWIQKGGGYYSECSKKLKG